MVCRDVQVFQDKSELHAPIRPPFTVLCLPENPAMILQ